MLKQLDLRNYRCLRDVSLRLSPLTALVGPSGTGKSAVLQALNPAIRLSSDDVWQRDRRLEALVTRTRADGAACTASFVSGRSPDAFVHQGERYLCQPLRLDLAALRHPDLGQERKLLAPDGGNLASLFGALPRGEQQRLSAQLGALLPDVQEAGVRSFGRKPGERGLCFRDRRQPEVWYRPDEVADGALLWLALLALGAQPERPDLITLEEPERALHPQVLGPLVQHLRALATGTPETPPVQVVLTTYSPVLLDQLQPDEVRFLHRDPGDGSVRAEEAPDSAPGPGPKRRKPTVSLGSAWLARGQ